MIDPRRAARLRAERRHGVITYRELMQVGLTPRRVDGMLGRSELERLHHGVYRFVGVRASPETRLTAALAGAGPRAWASHRTAAAIWQIPGFELRRPELTVVGNALPRLGGVVVHRSTNGMPLDVVTHGIWRVSRPALTLMQLGAVVDRGSVEKACEFAVLTDLVTPDELDVVLDRFGGPGMRGAATLRALLEERTQAPESELEWLLIGIVRRYCSFEPVIQHRVVIKGKEYRLDVAVPDVKVTVEGVGLRWHGGKDKARSDMRRRNALIADGWAVLEYGWSDCKRRPKGIGREIESMVQSRRSLAS